MLIAALTLALAAVQPAADAPDEQAEAAAYVEDPFDIQPESAVPPEEIESEPAAAPPPAAPSDKQLICRSRPELGTRLRYLRVCLTALEWQHHETNMEQQRRDINDWGAQGMGGTAF